MSTAVEDNFVTIVPVGEAALNAKPEPTDKETFVTVLSVGDMIGGGGAAEVHVRRPKGARLGLGLKFEGGAAAAEKVKRLLVQSCAPDSPAACARAPWGGLIPGDDILAIDGVPVTELTRIDCVRKLKDSDELLKLLIKHLNISEDVINNAESIEISNLVEYNDNSKLPPPVPPRKLSKKNSFKEKKMLSVAEFLSTDSENELAIFKKLSESSCQTNLSRKSSLDSNTHKGHLCPIRKHEGRRLSRRLSDGSAAPPEADVYVDLFRREYEHSVMMGEVESDDTSSSISTIVDRLSSLASSVDNSIPSTPILHQKNIDIQNLLSTMENLDAEFLTDISPNSCRELLCHKLSLHIQKKAVLKQVENDKGVKINKSDSSQQQTNKSDGNKNNADSSDVNSDSNNNFNAIVKNITSINIESAGRGIDSLDGAEGKDNAKDVAMQSKQNGSSEPPMPLPRNINRSGLSLKVAPASTSVADDALSPNKLNCIENWLQGSFTFKTPPPSEAKTNGSADAVLAEILPRLIDFVPKSQTNKEDIAQYAKSEPIEPPPLQREDGSGDSLDTIGEVDEADNSSREAIDEKRQAVWFKPNSDIFSRGTETNKPHFPEEAKIPPSCPRQPPDGDEAPPIPTETPPSQPKTRWLHSETLPKIPRKLFSRSQDARSECSVKDKIAMFSNQKSTSNEKIDKCIPKYPIAMGRPDLHTSNRVLTNKLDNRFAKSTDNLDNLSKRMSLDSREKRPEVVGSVGIKNAYKMDSDKTSRLKENLSKISSRRSVTGDNHKSTLDFLIEQRKKSMSKLRGLMIPETKPINDLPEIKIQENKIDDIKYQKIANFKAGDKYQNITSTKITSWTTAVPNIIPKYSPAFKRKSLQLFGGSPLSKEYKSKDGNENENIKIEQRKLSADSKNRAPSKPPRTSLENKKSYSSHTLNSLLHKTIETRTHPDFIIGKVSSETCVNKMGHKGDLIDSDNDSAVSSTQSSYRSSPSSPSLRNIDSVESDSSHCSLRSSDLLDNSAAKNTKEKEATGKTFVEYKKRNIYRSASSETNTSIASSGGSVLTSGSQASCSSMESSIPETCRPKIKNKSIEAINRRNILASAKCRSGRDFKINSPVIETKFSHDQDALDPFYKPSIPEKTSTLNVAVTKTDSCRRIRPTSIHDTDSDSDAERSNQRKYDFKSPRPRKSAYRQEQPKHENKPLEANTEVEKKLKINDARNGMQNAMIIASNRNKTDAKTAIECNPPDVCPHKSNINGNIVNTDVTGNGLTKAARKGNNTSECGSDTCQDTPRDLASKKELPSEKKHITEIDSTNSTIVRLERGAGAGIGLILAGGADCEAKNVTIHKILQGGPAYKDGRLSKGDRILSINNKCMDGLSHAESVAILKEPRTDVVLVVERNSDTNKNANEAVRKSSRSSSTTIQPRDVLNVELVKSGAGAGLGLSLEGGKDSPHGDGPLLIKKLFTGGAAARTGLIEVGAILEAVNGINVSTMTRTEAWNLLKSIPVGPVVLTIKPPTK